MALHPKLLQQEAFSRDFHLSEDRRKQLEKTSRQTKKPLQKEAIPLPGFCVHAQFPSKSFSLAAGAGLGTSFSLEGLKRLRCRHREIYPTVIHVPDHQSFDVGFLTGGQNPYYYISYSVDATYPHVPGAADPLH
jgi:hypothetical protein